MTLPAPDSENAGGRGSHSGRGGYGDGVSWDPRQYLRFSERRLRPALDLLGRVDLDAPRRIVDLGCGTGMVTPFLRDRWPTARVVGVDNAPEMLAVARAEQPKGLWIEADITTWLPDQPVDLVYSNAVLHWLDDHASLFPRLVALLETGGVLAVQMPHNYEQPSHSLAIDVARAGPWRDRLDPVLRPAPVGAPTFYHDVLAPVAGRIDVWQTIYWETLEGENPVVEWTKGSLLRPLLAALRPEEAAEFETEYRRRVAAAYPPRSDGSTLYPFERLFLVATAR